MHRPLRLTIDRTAIQENWRWLQGRAGVPAGAAVKADGYGLGAREAAQGYPLTFFASQSTANGVPNRRNMWSQLSHQPPMSKNIGLTGCGMWRSS